MRRHADAVEIKEPPIREFEKKSSCLKRTCWVGCGGVLFFMLIVIFAALYASKPHPREIRTLPPHFPTAVPIYDVTSTERMTLLSGSDRNRTLERIAILPKIIVSPFIIAFGKEEDASAWERFASLMDRPVTDQRDVLTASWTDLTASPQFIEQYYQTPLRKTGFDILDAGQGRTVRQFTFTKDDVSGLVSIRDNPDTPGTDEVTLTVHFPPVQ